MAFFEGYNMIFMAKYFISIQKLSTNSFDDYKISMYGLLSKTLCQLYICLSYSNVITLMQATQSYINILQTRIANLPMVRTLKNVYLDIWRMYMCCIFFDSSDDAWLKYVFNLQMLSNVSCCHSLYAFQHLKQYASIK